MLPVNRPAHSNVAARAKEQVRRGIHATLVSRMLPKRVRRRIQARTVSADASRAEPHTHEPLRLLELARRPEPRRPEPMMDAGR
jgi:hypothetical protein